jgi:SpoIID/LytB domain protein
MLISGILFGGGRMKRRIAAIFVVIFFTLTSTAYAFDSSAYNKEIKIGLETMASNQIKVTLNGSYTCLGSMLPAGTSFYLAASGNSISYNGNCYNELNFVPVNDENTIKLQAGTKAYNYLGEMDFKVNPGKILPVNELPIEDYLKGVIGYEMSNSYPIEALKAQAVAARNYAISNMDKHRSDGYDLCDTIDCQVYRGYNPSYKNVEKAVDETRGQVLLYGDQLITAYYASSDGGYTEDSGNVWTNQLPYLIAKPDAFDSNSWPYGDMTFTSAEIENTLKDKKYLNSTDTFNKIDLTTIKKYESGRIANIDVDYTDAGGTAHTRSFSKESARTFLGLPSAMYDVFYDAASDTYTFKGKGYGHGVGMSQRGAQSRANSGQAYDTILAFYYDGTYLKQLLSNIKTFTSDKQSILAGDKILFNTSCDSSSSLFKFTVEKDGKVLYTRDYMSSASFEYSPQSAGSYTAHVYMKSSSSQNEYNDTASLGFTVYSLPVITSISQGLEQHVKRPVEISVNTSGGSSRGRQYKFEVLYNSTHFSGCDYQDASTYEFTSDVEGAYTVKVYVKDKLSTRTYDSMKDTVVNVTSDTSRGSTTTLDINVPVKKGMKNSSVKVLQNCLIKLGYKVGTADGIFGSKTLNAVISFQKSKGLTQSGIVDAKTLSALNAEIQKKSGSAVNPVTPPPVAVDKNTLNITRILKKGVKGSDVKTVQQVLNKLGYSVGTADGIYGTKTYNAIKTYQTANKLPVTGTVESRTASSLSSKYSAYLNSTASRGTSTITFSISRVLKLGTRGTDVKNLQQVLKHLSFAVNVNGVFNNQTYIAVKSFQKQNHLVVDGIVGTGTARAINARLK